MQQPIPPGEKGASQALKPQHSVRFVAPAPSVRGEVSRIPVKEDDEDPDVDVSALVQEFNQSHVDATGLQSAVRGSHGPAPEPQVSRAIFDSIFLWNALVMRFAFSLAVQRAPAAMPFMWSRVVTKGTSAPPPASLKSYPTATSTPAGTIGPIAPVTLSGSGDAEAGSAPPATVDTPEDTEANKEETKKLIKWVEYFIRQHGGRVIGANLGSALASSNGAMYRTIKCERASHLHAHSALIIIFMNCCDVCRSQVRWPDATPVQVP